MFRTYNMGIGMMIAVDQEDVDKTLMSIRKAGETPYIVGEITAGEQGVTII